MRLGASKGMVARYYQFAPIYTTAPPMTVASRAFLMSPLISVKKSSLVQVERMMKDLPEICWLRLLDSRGHDASLHVCFLIFVTNGGKKIIINESNSKCV